MYRFIRPSHRDWFKFLRENDKDLNQILEFEENLRKVVFQSVESLTAEQLDFLRDAFAQYYTKPKESLDILDLQHSSLRSVVDHYRETDENYVKKMKSKYSKQEPLIKFQKDFDSLLTTFCLEKKWLAESVFTAICNGTGKLQMEIGFYENPPKEIFYEIQDRLKQKKITGTEDEMMDHFNKFLLNNIPLPNPFQFQGPYQIIFPIEAYEETAVAAYRQHLRDYFKIIEESFKEHGYKQSQGNTEHFDRVKWLVLWTVKKLRKDEILKRMDEERSTKYNEETYTDVSTLNTAFRKFRKFDLPVREE